MEIFEKGMARNFFKLLHRREPQTEKDEEEMILFYFGWLEKEQAEVRRLPKKVLEGVADERAYAVGF